MTDTQDWRTELEDSPKLQTLKLQEREVVFATFEDEGIINHHPDFGDSIRFQLKKQDESEPRFWYVKANNFSLLRQIKSLGKLSGLKVEIRREGSKKSDTRYFIKKI